VVLSCECGVKVRELRWEGITWAVLHLSILPCCCCSIDHLFTYTVFPERSSRKSSASKPRKQDKDSGSARQMTLLGHVSRTPRNEYQEECEELVVVEPPRVKPTAAAVQAALSRQMKTMTTSATISTLMRTGAAGGGWARPRTSPGSKVAAIVAAASAQSGDTEHVSGFGLLARSLEQARASPPAAGPASSRDKIKTSVAPMVVLDEPDETWIKRPSAPASAGRKESSVRAPTRSTHTHVFEHTIDDSEAREEEAEEEEEEEEGEEGEEGEHEGGHDDGLDGLSLSPVKHSVPLSERTANDGFDYRMFGTLSRNKTDADMDIVPKQSRKKGGQASGGSLAGRPFRGGRRRFGKRK
jgi:hypothetical protein